MLRRFSYSKVAPDVDGKPESRFVHLAENPPATQWHLPKDSSIRTHVGLGFRVSQERGEKKSPQETPRVGRSIETAL